MGCIIIIRKSLDDPLILTMHIRWVWQLSKTASSLGLQPITHETIRMRDEYRTFWNQSNLLALEDFASKMEGDRAAEVEALLMRVGDEFAQGVSLDAEWFCDVWRKP